MEKITENANNLAKELISTADVASYIQVVNPTTGKVSNIKISDLASVVAAAIGLVDFKVRKVQVNNEGSSVYNGGLSNSSITYVVDASERTKYILSHTYYNIDRSDVVHQTVISNNGLSFGASNKMGTQVINGTTNDVIFYIMYFV